MFAVGHSSAPRLVALRRHACMLLLHLWILGPSGLLGKGPLAGTSFYADRSPARGRSAHSLKHPGPTWLQRLLGMHSLSATC